MAGGYKFMALLFCAQCLSEVFEYLGQNTKNSWASEEARDQQSQYWQYMQHIMIITSI